MSDRTCAQIFIYGCPEGQRDDLLKALRYTFWPGDDLDWGILPVPFAAEEAECGTIEKHATRWARAAIGATWVAWEAPEPEWLGTVAYCLRGEVVTFPCDAEGHPVATLGAALAAGVRNEALDRLFPGYAVVEQFEELVARAA
jgi:hypothetical protein